MEWGIKWSTLKETRRIKGLLKTNTPIREGILYNRWEETGNKSQWGGSGVVTFNISVRIMGETVTSTTLIE